ncbi:MAG: TlpA family protein disulfide reductase, partial [Akkermansiaceae bacterium]|nr:TlpA family protein disulfide reductase [Akkermansiaceae bacterium]
MKMSALLLLGGLALPLSADDFNFAFEGDQAQRARLAALQDSREPPGLQLSDWINSEAVQLDDLRGKIVVLDFWATWCGPCIAGIPKNNEIHEKFGEDVVLIGVCHPRGAEKMARMVKDKGIKYPVAIDKDRKTIEAYRVNGYPDYYIFNRD